MQKNMVFTKLHLPRNLTQYSSNFQTIKGSPSKGSITLLIREITFRLYQISIYVITIHQRYRRTDRETDRQTDRH